MSFLILFNEKQKIKINSYQAFSNMRVKGSTGFVPSLIVLSKTFTISKTNVKKLVKFWICAQPFSILRMLNKHTQKHSRNFLIFFSQKILIYLPIQQLLDASFWSSISDIQPYREQEINTFNQQNINYYPEMKYREVFLVFHTSLDTSSYNDINFCNQVTIQVIKQTSTIEISVPNLRVHTSCQHGFIDFLLLIYVRNNYNCQLCNCFKV